MIQPSIIQLPQKYDWKCVQPTVGSPVLCRHFGHCHQPCHRGQDLLPTQQRDPVSRTMDRWTVPHGGVSLSVPDDVHNSREILRCHLSL